MPELTINNGKIVQGVVHTVDFSLYDDNGDVVSLASDTLRMTFVGLPPIAGTTFERTTSNSNHVNWITQAEGKGTWTFLPTESFTVGVYEVAVYLLDSSTLTPRLIGTCTYKIVAAPTTVPS